MVGQYGASKPDGWMDGGTWCSVCQATSSNFHKKLTQHDTNMSLT